jgi:uncharacterized protein YbjT (DUF2867 family)
MNMKRICVAGATGQQGGAVARHLLRQSGFSVRALVRDPDKPSARALAQAGAELVRADFDDPASLRPALEETWGAFSVQNFLESGYAGEIRQGKQFANAAEAAGVRHFVYSSVVSADKNTGLPHFESKWRIEQHIAQLNCSWTILRPAFFMQNWYGFLRGAIQGGTIPLPCRPQTSLQQISVEDIGHFAALVFQDANKWKGRTIELAGDELTLQGVAQLFTQLLGRNVNYVQVPWEQFRQQAGEEMMKMYRWFDEVGYHVDIVRLRQDFPFLSTLEQVLRQQHWEADETGKRSAA